jgi:CHAD domain-containing protein
MDLKITRILNISEGVKDIICRECEHAVRLLEEETQENPHLVVHEVRKSFKKIRALLRLVRDETAAYHQENRFFRDEGRKISDVRDATALIEALDLLSAQYSDQLYKNAFSDFRKILVDKRDDLVKETLEKENTLMEIRQNISHKCGSIKDLPLTADSFDSIALSIERVYKRGRKGYEKARESADPEDFHEWRKRVKYLQYQLQAIHLVWPKLLNTWEDELHRLSDFLGTDRDIFMLRNFIDGNKSQLEADELTYLLRNLLDGHSEQLRQHALLLGKGLYHLQPKDFVSLLGAAWEAYGMRKDQQLVPSEKLES